MWQEKDNILKRSFKFDDFDQAVEFVSRVFEVAKKLDHHPTLTNTYNKVDLALTTHSAGDKITDKDRKFAQEIDEVLGNKAKGNNEFQIYTDGGSRGNPGPAAIGFVIYNADKDVVKKYKEFIGETTNNIAEYKALIAALEEAGKHGGSSISVYMDSELIVKQMRGEYKVKHADLKPLHQKVARLVDSFAHVSFAHVKREKNTIADALVNEALDEA